MSSQDKELESLIAALQADMPDAQDRERMRARLASAGIAVSAAAGAGAVGGSAAKAAAAATAGAAGEGAVVIAAGTGAATKVAGLSLAAKLGWSAAVIASASALSLAPRWYESRAARPEAGGKPIAAAAPAIAAREDARASAPTAPAALQPEGAEKAPQPLQAVAAEAAVAPAAPEPSAVRASGVVAAGSVRAEAGATATRGAARRRVESMPSGSSVAVAIEARSSAVPVTAPAATPIEVPAGDAVDRLNGKVAPASAAAEPALQPEARPSTLHEEAELLQRALAALHAGDRASARRLLAAHEARFPNSVLMRERERARRHLEQLSE